MEYARMEKVPADVELKSFDYLVLLAVFNKKKNQYMVRKPRIAVQVGEILGRDVTTIEVGVAMDRLERDRLICNGRVTKDGVKRLWG